MPHDPPVALLVALLDGAVKAVAYLPGQSCVIGDLLLAGSLVSLASPGG